MSAETAVRRMWMLNCGWIRVDASLLMYRHDFGAKVTVPVSATLVETADGYLLFDTGLNPAAAADPKGALGAKAETLVQLDGGHDVREHLATLGLAPGDVRWMTNSHLHWDHTGGNTSFRESEFLVQREELRFAQDPDAFVAQIFLQSQFEGFGKPTVLDGDHVVAEGLGLISLRGHTPGHQSLLARLPSGRTVLCAGDAAYRAENLVDPWPPGNPWSMPDAYRSLLRMRFLRDFFDVEIFIGHDPDAWDADGPRIRELT